MSRRQLTQYGATTGNEEILFLVPTPTGNVEVKQSVRTKRTGLHMTEGGAQVLSLVSAHEPKRAVALLADCYPLDLDAALKQRISQWVSAHGAASTPS